MKSRILIATSLLLAPLAGRAEENAPPPLIEQCAVEEEEDFPTPSDVMADEREEWQPTGKVVGRAGNEMERKARRERLRNWAIAACVTIIGIVTLILVARHHDK